MIKSKGYAAKTASSMIEPFAFERREVGDNDILIDILFCGICHSDIHQARNEWGGSQFPMVPGHEILGTVTKVGSKVSKFKMGDRVGVGCFVDSCRTCQSCKKGVEQYCDGQLVVTYNGLEKDKKTPTYGGYSTNIVVDENYALRVPTHLDQAGVAPLLCAGITTYSPLRYCGVTKGHRVGVMGLGGLGHMAVKFAAAFGAEVTVFSTSKSKEADAKRMGAHDFVSVRDEAKLASLQQHFDFLLNTVSAPHPIGNFFNLLKTDGTMIVVGIPDKPFELGMFPLIMKRRRLLGSLIGGIAETQEMLDFCGQHKITCDVEVIEAKRINEAYERMLRSDVKYRFVIDAKTI